MYHYFMYHRYIQRSECRTNDRHTTRFYDLNSILFMRSRHVILTSTIGFFASKSIRNDVLLSREHSKKQVFS